MAEKITLASIVNKVKTMFSDVIEEEETKMAEAVVADTGIIVRAESWEVGQPVVAVTEEGEEIMPAGSYVLDNGVTLVIAEDGTIAEVIEAAEVEAKKDDEKEDMAAEKPTYVTQEDFTDAMSEMTKALERVSTKLSAIKLATAPDVEKLKADNKSLALKLSEKRKAIADKPAEKKDILPANFGKSDRGHRSGTKEAVAKKFKDFDFKITQTTGEVEV